MMIGGSIIIQESLFEHNSARRSGGAVQISNG
eukprot:COSAG02_NODE_59342_length_274_cov_1.148571_1_plen_31_part_01